MWEFEQYENRVALIDDNGNKVTYIQLHEYGNKIREIINERTLVFCLCENSIGSIIGYTSFLNSHVVPIMLNSHMDLGQYQRLLDIYMPEYIWLPEDSKINGIKTFEIVFSVYGYSLVKTDFGRKVSLNENLAILLSTSGSTGSPKLVRQSYNNIKRNSESIISYLELDSSERAITTLPMNYTYGLSIINTHLLVGACLLLTDKSIIQKEFWNFLCENKATSFGGVPYTYEILNRLHFFNMDLPSLRYFTQAGGKLSAELHEKFAKYAFSNNKKFFVMYGQCEATARMTYLPYSYSIFKIGSIGIAIPGGRIELRDEDNCCITEPEKEGELIYFGDNVTLGYAENLNDLSKGDERNGQLHTGDIAKMDKDGFLYIIGRKKRFLKIYGNRVNLDEIDQLIKNKFNDVDAVSTGRDDHLFIVLTNDKHSTEIRKFVSETIKINISAIKCVIIDSLPQNESGKVLYNVLEEYCI